MDVLPGVVMLSRLMQYGAAATVAVVVGLAWEWAGPVVYVPLQVVLILWFMEKQD